MKHSHVHSPSPARSRRTLRRTRPSTIAPLAALVRSSRATVAGWWSRGRFVREPAACGPVFETLEPRMLLSADLAGLDDTDGETSQVLIESLESPPAIIIADEPTVGIVQEGGVFSRDPEAETAVLSVQDLEAALDLGSMIVSAESADGSGDIVIADDLSWDSGWDLTLMAEADVHLLEAVTVTNTGGGGLTLRGDQFGAGEGRVEFADGAHIDFDGGGTIEILDNPLGGYENPQDFGSHVTVSEDDRLRAMMLVNTVDDLQAIARNLAGNYALGRDIDAAQTAEWNEQDGEFLGFEPIGEEGEPFLGTLDGRGHMIDDLVIDRPSLRYVGLFGRVEGNATIQSLSLKGGQVHGLGGGAFGVHGGVGGVVGWMEDATSISDASASADVSGEDRNVGGLVGRMQDNASIADASASGDVSGEARVGGLVGRTTHNVSIAVSAASGDVSGIGNYVGGLVGSMWGGGSINASSASGEVSGDGLVGGLVGWMQDDASITDAFASGDVSGVGAAVGGLVGSMGDSSITDAYALGSVSGRDYVGGLVASMRGSASIADVYAVGSVSGRDVVGGLVGSIGDDASISDASASGDVNGDADVGGLVGRMTGDASINASSASGNVSSNGNFNGDSDVGGLARQR